MTFKYISLFLKLVCCLVLSIFFGSVSILPVILDIMSSPTRILRKLPIRQKEAYFQYPTRINC